MKSLIPFLAVVVAAACGTPEEPSSFGVNLRIHADGLSVEERGRVASVKVTVSGDVPDPYVKMIDVTQVIGSGEIRSHYVPKKTSGMLTFQVTALEGDGSTVVASTPSVPVTLTDGAVRLDLVLSVGSAMDFGTDDGGDMGVIKGQGDSCSTSAECGTAGGCVDGVCCDTPCADVCMACNVTGSIGTCTTVPVGTPPSHGSCQKDAVSSCGRDGTCDGSGSCRLYPQGTACSSASCNTGTNQFTPASKCDGKGICVPLAPYDCAPFKCKDATSCYDACTDSTACSGTNSCVGGSCGLLANGRTCTQGTQCTTNNCVDGVCCSSACTGQCQACDIPDTQGKLGTCMTVTSGAPHLSHAPCVGTGTVCGGSCTGASATSCTYPPTTTACGSSCKTNATETDFFCNGAGSCSTTGVDKACIGFVCAGNKCGTTCSVNTQCQSNYVCMSPNCINGCTNGVKDGNETDVDCGGPDCSSCAPNKVCKAQTDCVTGSCVSGYCSLVSGPPFWLPAASTPAAHESLAGTLGKDGRIWVNDGNSSVDAYDPLANSWSTGVAHSGGFRFAAMATHPDGRIFRVGGSDTNYYSQKYTQALVPGQSTWSLVANLNNSRSSGAAVQAAGMLFVFGGSNSSPLSSTPVTKVERYEAADSWTQVGDCGGGDGIAAAVGSDGRAYVMGGYANGFYSSAFQSFAPSNNTCTTLATLPEQRAFLGAASGPDGRIYAVGGTNGNASVARVDAYSILTNTWAGVAALSGPRQNLAVVGVPDGRIFAIAGYNGQAVATVEAYGPIISLSATTGAAGTSVTVSGGNFAANATVTIYWNGPSGTALATGTTSATGAITTPISIRIPSTAAGAYRIFASDNKAVYPVSRPFTVN